MREKSGRGHAIDIVIAKYGDSLFLFQCLNHPFHGLTHVRHQKWIVQAAKIRFQKIPGRLQRSHPTIHKKHRHRGGKMESALKQGHRF